MKIKADKMCELEKFGFIEYIDYFIKQVTKQREFTKEEIVKTIFQLSKIYLESKGERTCTFHNKQQSITISADEWRGGQ